MAVLELTDEPVIALLEQLPAEQKKRVLDLLAREAPASARPQFGSAKDDILFMADDFDAPLEDFKEYM